MQALASDEPRRTTATMTLNLTLTLAPFWRDLSPATRTSYRQGWRAWCAWCSTVNVKPLKASQTDAQAWVDSLVARGYSPNYIQNLNVGTRATLEYLAMMGYQPHEPHRLVALPARTPVITSREPLNVERIARALADTIDKPRAHAILWACAGMGLSSADLSACNQPGRIKRVGAAHVAVVSWKGVAELVPLPRELALIVADTGWPIVSANANTAKNVIVGALRGVIRTNAKELRDWHRSVALPTEHRLRFSEHPSIAVCDLLRKELLDFRAR